MIPEPWVSWSHRDVTRWSPLGPYQMWGSSDHYGSSWCQPCIMCSSLTSWLPLLQAWLAIMSSSNKLGLTWIRLSFELWGWEKCILTIPNCNIPDSDLDLDLDLDLSLTKSSWVAVTTPRAGEINDCRHRLWGRVIGLGSCHANRRYRVRGDAVSCGEHTVCTSLTRICVKLKTLK